MQIKEKIIENYEILNKRQKRLSLLVSYTLSITLGTMVVLISILTNIVQHNVWKILGTVLILILSGYLFSIPLDMLFILSKQMEK